MKETVLSLKGLGKAFGALKAVDDVHLDITQGGVHAIIGPNGAGKTTLINMLAGDEPPTAGRIEFKGQDITELPHHRCARLGIGRSYQKTNIFPDRTCLENCWVGAYGATDTGFRLWRPARAYDDVQTTALTALETCGLAPRAHDLAADLSHGEQRQLEIAMVLATKPELLLLDEPLAGMGVAESEQAARLIQDLGQRHTVVLIEHDMDVVFQIADRITVLSEGRVIASDTPDAIHTNAAVQAVYLGHDGVQDETEAAP